MTHRQKLTLRWAALAGAAALTAASLFFLAGPRDASLRTPPAGIRALPVRVERVGPPERLVATRRFAGSLRARREAALAFELPGRVDAVLVADGERVEAGATLARIDVSRVAAERDAVRAQKAAAEARLAELEAGPRRQTIDAARAAVAALEERLALAELQTRRRSELAASGAIASEELDVVARGAAALAAERDAAAANLAELEEGTRAEVIATQRATVENLAAGLARLELDLADAELVAPFDALVQDRVVDEGAFVAAGTPVLHLVEEGPLEARIGVPTRLARELVVGSVLTVRVDDEGVPAVLESALPVLDAATRTSTLVLTIDDATPFGLRPGQVARIELEDEAAETPEGHRLPLSALTRGVRGLWEVYVTVEDGDASVVERREVEWLGTDGETVLVRGLLTVGDEVVVDGLQRVVPGQRVSPTSDEGTAR